MNGVVWLTRRQWLLEYAFAVFVDTLVREKFFARSQYKYNRAESTGKNRLIIGHDTVMNIKMPLPFRQANWWFLFQVVPHTWDERQFQRWLNKVWLSLTVILSKIINGNKNFMLLMFSCKVDLSLAQSDQMTLACFWSACCIYFFLWTNGH